MLAVKIHRASLPACSGTPLILNSLDRLLLRISHLFVDKEYTGDPLREWITQHLHWTVKIVLSEHNKAHQKWELRNGQPVLIHLSAGVFQVQRKQWVVERTLAWLTHFRRLSRDYEGLTTSSEAFLQLGAIRHILSRLSPFRY